MAAASLSLSGCAATSQVAPSPAVGEVQASDDGGEPSGSDDGQRLRFDPLEIHPGSAEEVALADLNADELLALGQSSYAAGDMEKAALAFGRMADAWPDSPFAVTAAYHAGLSLEKLGRPVEAGNRFASIADASNGQLERLQAAFHLAAILYQLDDFERAEGILRTIRERTDLEKDERLQAMVQHSVCLVEMGRLEDGEDGFVHALNFWKAYRNEEPFDDFIPAQAQFFLGEISRLKFEAVTLNPESADEDALRDALERKCRLLLEAQERYLVAIRMNDSHWATSAGYRVGALYERLHDEMMAAKSPEGMDEEEAAIYRDELKKKVRILVTKALPIYEQTLAAAERTGTKTPFVDKAREGLERLRAILTEGEEGVPASPGNPEGATQPVPEADGEVRVEAPLQAPPPQTPAPMGVAAPSPEGPGAHVPPGQMAEASPSRPDRPADSSSSVSGASLVSAVESPPEASSGAVPVQGTSEEKSEPANGQPPSAGKADAGGADEASNPSKSTSATPSP